MKENDTPTQEANDEDVQVETATAEATVAADTGEETAGTETGNAGGALSPLSQFTRNEDAEQRPNLTLREILGGDILTTRWLRRQIGLIILCVFFIIIYITNRYSAEQELITIKDLKIELQEMKYRALTRSSELTEKTRQSHIEEQLMQNGDSTLRMSKEPPFIIKIQPEE